MGIKGRVKVGENGMIKSGRKRDRVKVGKGEG